MKLTETGKIEVKTFSIDNTREFDVLGLHEKLERLDSLVNAEKEESSFTSETIGLCDAFEKAMNEMYNGKGNVALIVEMRIITLDKSIQKKAIAEIF